MADEQRKLRVGIIGCGIGVFHLEGYEKEPRAEVVALAGLDTARCIAWVSGIGGASGEIAMTLAPNSATPAVAYGRTAAFMTLL